MLFLIGLQKPLHPSLAKIGQGTAIGLQESTLKFPANTPAFWPLFIGVREVEEVSLVESGIHALPG
jgi:hypothetical protein